MIPKPALALVGLALAAGSSFAASLQVTVTGADGKPAADAVVQVVAPGAAPPPAGTVTIEQKDIRFVPYVAAVPLGSSVRFVNRDGYDHHIRTLPGGPLGTVAPAKTFELRLAAARRSGDTSEPIVLDTPGTIVLGCHLHGSMRGHLFVSASPFVAVTDERGRVRLDNLPDAPVELRVWHPDQIVELAPQRITLAGNASSEVKLGFTPRRRPPPRTLPPDEYRQ